MPATHQTCRFEFGASMLTFTPSSEEPQKVLRSQLTFKARLNWESTSATEQIGSTQLSSDLERNNYFRIIVLKSKQFVLLLICPPPQNSPYRLPNSSSLHRSSGLHTQAHVQASVAIAAIPPAKLHCVVHHPPSTNPGYDNNNDHTRILSFL